ncbi:kielin/chordin-like protein [Mizuhopecten yessoensis]|uniref:kielin/chordin-like protein n=1 Tax=Mizuhopecten yessoensis TaxID=6573 RepID=UPI000B45BCF4|nr:kielin/chordin-like protein [Mizuhopecten yessoensis]
MMWAVILMISAVHLHGSLADPRCPPNMNGFGGVCAFMCGSGGCDSGKICCPTACGGTTCQTPRAPPAPQPLPSPCPPGVPMASCSHLPCDKESCPNYPYAKCVNNYCGGCNAKFYLKGKEVTKTCTKTSPIKPHLPSPCKKGVHMVQCFANPCDVQQCPSLPHAACVSDYCGGCNARFYINNEEVTGMCRSGRRPIGIRRLYG